MRSSNDSRGGEEATGPRRSGAEPHRALPPGFDAQSADAGIFEAQALLEQMAHGSSAGPMLAALTGTLFGNRSRQQRTGSEGDQEGERGGIWAAELRYRALVESIPAVTFMVSLEENVHELYVSPQIETLLGFTQEEWLQDPFLWYKQLHPDDRYVWNREFARTCATGVHFKAQYRFFARDGHVVWVQGEAQMVRDDDGHPLFLQGIAFDITEIKRAEETLQRSQEHLEAMVRQRTSELARVNESLRDEIAERGRLEQELHERNRELAQESERKDHFLAVLAHELRNPLAPITMALEVIRRGTASPGDLAWAQGMMERQVRQMSRLIDDLLDVSRIKRGKVELHTELLDLRTVVQRSIDTIRPTIKDRRLELVTEFPDAALWVDGDAVRLEQVAVNLLTNATKFTRPGGRVRLRVGIEDDEAVLSVADTGVGIPPDMLEHIFDLFAQIDRSTSRTNQWGMGIGLALVRGLVELHGGSVKAFSDGPGTGSEFLVRLPLTPAGDRVEAIPLELDELHALPTRSILVVDDHKEFARSLAMLLRSWSQDVEVVHSGEQALRSAHQRRADIVLLDLGMPGKDGFQVARELRLSPLRHAAIIALSGYGRAEDRQRAAAAGFDRHLTKPVAPAALHAVLAELAQQPGKMP